MIKTCKLNVFYYAFLLTDDRPKNVPITETYSDLTTTSKTSERDEFTTYTDTTLYTNKESTTTTLSPNLDNTESSTENRPTIMTIADINTTPEQLITTKESAVVIVTTQSTVAITSVHTHTFTENYDIQSTISTVATSDIESRTESEDNIITDKEPIDLESTTFANVPRTTGTTISETSTETALTMSTSGTTSYITEKLPTQVFKSVTESKDMNETTTNTPYSASNDGTEFATRNTIIYTNTGSKNYSTTLDSDELVQSSSTIHVESTEKPYIKRNESIESSTPSTESKNTKNPENQRQLNNNYTETTQAIKLSTSSLHTSPDIDTTTSSKMYTIIPVMTTETTEVVTTPFSKPTTINEIDTETVDKITDNIMTLIQTTESNMTDVVTANNLEVTSSTESKIALTESMSTASPLTIVHEPSTINTELDKISTLQSEQSTETIGNTQVQYKIDSTTGTSDSHIQELLTQNEFSVTTVTNAEFTFDQTRLSQTNSSPVSTSSTIEDTETDPTGVSTKSTNEVDLKENEGSTLPDIGTKNEPEVTTQLQRNEITDYTTESTSFTHSNIGTESKINDFTTTDTSMFRTTTDAQHLTKSVKKPMSDTITTDSESATYPTVLKEVTSKTFTDHAIQTSYDIKLETSTPLTYATQTEISNTITDTSYEISTQTFKDDITTNTLKGQENTAGLNSMTTTEYLTESRTKISTNDDTTSSLRSTSSYLNLEKTTESRKDTKTTSSNLESLKKVTEFSYSEADTTEKEIVNNQQSSTIWEDIQTSSQKTPVQTRGYDDNFSTQNYKEPTRNIKDTVPFTTPTIQSQFSTHSLYEDEDHSIIMSSRPRTTEIISDSSTSKSFTNTDLFEATTTTTTKRYQEDITKPYKISTPTEIDTTTREYTDKYTELDKEDISTINNKVGASTTVSQDTITQDNFTESTKSPESHISTATRDLDVTTDNSSYNQIDKMVTQETSETTSELLPITSTTTYKSILGSTTETITTQTPESEHDSTTVSNEVNSAGASTSNIIVTQSYPTNTTIAVTTQNIDNQSTTVEQNENTEGVSSMTSTTISSQSDITNTYSGTTPEPTGNTRLSIESTTEQFFGSQSVGQETDTTAAHTTSESIGNNVSHDMDYTGTQFESTVDNIVIMTPITSTTNIYGDSTTEATTNIQEVTSEIETFITTTQSESKSRVTFIPSTFTNNSYNASITDASAAATTNTQESTTQSQTQSGSKPQATSTIPFSPVTNTPTINQRFDITTTLITVAENIEKSPDISTSTENMSSRQRENVDISAWPDSTSTTDLTSTENSVQTTETVTNLKQCEVNSQCSVDKACLNGVCQNPCETARSLCTKSVACKVVNHTAVCECDDAAGVYCVIGMHFLFAYHS